MTLFRSITSLCGGLALIASAAHADLTWSVYVDQTGLSSPTSEARSLRGIAVNPQATALFGSYINGSTSHLIKQYDADVDSAAYGDEVGSFTTSTGNAAAKAITVDDRGNIFTARPDDDTAQIRVFDSTYDRIASVAQGAFGHTKTANGIDVVKSGSDYLLYTTGASSSSGFVNRWNVNNASSPTADTTFNGTAASIDLTTIAGASNATYLRGIEVAGDGTIYTASLDNGYVHRISSDLSSAISGMIPRAHDVAVFGNELYAVTYDGVNSRVYVLDATTLEQIDVIDPLAGLSLTRGTEGGFSSIEIDADGRIYVADQVYASSGSAVSDRILVSTIPEPTSLMLLLGMSGLAIRRRRAA